MRRKGPPTADDIRAKAERTYRHFSPSRILASIGLGKPTYFYVSGVTTLKHKRLTLGPIPREEAEEIGAELLDGEVFELETYSLKTAKEQIKAELLRRGENPDVALERMYQKE